MVYYIGWHLFRKMTSCNFSFIYYCRSLSLSIPLATIREEIKKDTNVFSHRTHNCGELRLKDVGLRVRLYGWLARKHMKRFLLLRDAYGDVQAILKSNKFASQIDTIPLESSICIEGIVVDRGKDRKLEMATGDIEVLVDHLEVLNLANIVLPVFDHSNEATRLTHRYLDLRSCQMQQALRFRAKMISQMRRYLEDQCGFIDVQTPTLAHFTPDGSAEFLVPANKSGECFSLPQSPQIYKQLLMCGAIDRYYQIAMCYRDEDIKPDRQPEFTQLDLEMSFTDQDSIMSLIEQVIMNSWPEGLLKPTTPFPRREFAEIMKKFGTDKPDLRIPWQILDCPADFVADKPNAKMFIAKSAAKSLTLENLSLWRERIGKLCCKQEYEILCPGSSQLPFLCSNYLHKNKYNISEEDVIVFCWSEQRRDVYKVLGYLRNYLADAIGVRATQRFEFLWVHKFPLFTRNQTTGALESTHHPFTAPVPEHLERLKDGIDLERIEAQHYDLVLNGVEIGGGSIRIHNGEMQRHVLDRVLQLKSSHLAHFITALSYGAPPHGGFALGVDRYVAILNARGNTNVSIRSVIAFPKASSGRCLMTDSPETPSRELLNRYGLSPKVESNEK